MKTTMLNERSTPTHSTAIERYRRSKAKRNELPTEIKSNDIGWGTTFTVLFSTLSVGVFFLALFFLVQIFGAQF